MKTTDYLIAAAVAGAGYLAYKLANFNPAQALANTTLKGEQFMAEASELMWEVRYSANSSGLTGFKPFRSNAILNTLANWADPHIASIKWHAKNNSMLSIGGSAQWFMLESYPFLRSSTGKQVVSIKGDPRALWTLARLASDADLDPMTFLGMYVWQGGRGDTTHDYGHAIDLAPAEGGRASLDASINRLVDAARERHCPIAWISPYQTQLAIAGQMQTVWPMFQLRNGIKTRFNYSRQSHSNPWHYHIVLPRPDWALTLVDRLDS